MTTVKSQGNTATIVESALYCAQNTLVVAVTALTLTQLKLNVLFAIAHEK